MSEQFFSTSRLSNVMKLIMLGHQTGLLLVGRGVAAAREEGSIQFINGEIAMATVGQLRGSAAMAVLQNWGESTYQFLDGVNQLQAGQSDGLVWGQSPGSGPLPPPGSGSFTGGFGATGPQSGYPSSSFPPTNSNTGAPGYAPRTPTNYPQASDYPGAGYGPPNGGYPPTGPNGTYPPTGPWRGGPLPAGQAGMLAATFVPRRLGIPDANNLPLDRRERQILLLIDGRRSVSDLMRLTRRGGDEVQYILAHLIALSLVE